MKKIIVILSIFSLMFAKVNVQQSCHAKAETSTYAKALSDCVMYRSSELNYDANNVYFVIPESYFLTVLENVSDECMKVQYDKYVGYVDSSTVIVATFIPIVKTLKNVTCDIKETSGTQIWSLPSTEGNVLTTISAGTKNISYVAFVYGDLPSGGESNLWFYVSYTPSFNSTNVYEGYIYSENVTNISEIVLNTESNPEVINEKISDDNLFLVSSSMKTILVVIVAIPIILLILIILYKFTQKFKNNTNKTHFENNLYGKETTRNIENFETEEVSMNESLKSNLNKLKNNSFVKLNKNFFVKKNRSYPEFPTYDSEDDLL